MTDTAEKVRTLRYDLEEAGLEDGLEFHHVHEGLGELRTLEGDVVARVVSEDHANLLRRSGEALADLLAEREALDARVRVLEGTARSAKHHQDRAERQVNDVVEEERIAWDLEAAKTHALRARVAALEEELAAADTRADMAEHVGGTVDLALVLPAHAARHVRAGWILSLLRGGDVRGIDGGALAACLVAAAQHHTPEMQRRAVLGLLGDLKL